MCLWGYRDAASSDSRGSSVVSIHSPAALKVFSRSAIV